MLASPNHSISNSSFLSKSIHEIIDDFLMTKKSSQTQKAYQKDIQTFFELIQISTIEELASVPVSDLSKTIVNYAESFKKTEKHRKDRLKNPRTVNRKAYALSSFFEFLIANYGYPRNPVKVYIPYSAPDSTSTQDLDENELLEFWQYVKDELDYSTTDIKILYSYQQLLIVSFLMLSLRRNEIANIRRDDWNTQKGFITVYGKGQKYKYIPLNKKITSYLIDFKQSKSRLGFASEYIFSPFRNNSTSDSSKPISGAYIYKLVKKISETLKLNGKIGIDKKITPHSFRTTFVKLALEQGKTDIEIMNTTGHSTSAMVKYYDSRSKLDVNSVGVIDNFFE